MLTLIKKWLRQNQLTADDELLATESLNDRRARLTKLIALVMIISTPITVLVFGGNFLTNTNKTANLITAIATFLAFATSWASWWLITRRQVILAGWIIICTIMYIVTFFCIIVGTGQAVQVMYLMAILLAWLILGSRGGIVVAGLSVAVCAFLPIAEKSLKWFAPQIETEPHNLAFSWAITIVLVGGMIGMVVNLLNRVGQLGQRQNQQLATALKTLQAQHQMGQSFSLQVFSTSSELSQTAHRQSKGSQQQAAALSQVNTSLAELTQTASVIAQNARKVAASMEQTVREASQLATTTELASQVSSSGREAILNSVEANQQVGSLYQVLVDTLSNLAERADNIQIILDLIESIAKETHLLSLNAAIEAAGAGEYGQRFGVVAHEVKKLADRAQLASRDVRKLVQEIEGGVNKAVVTVENGQDVATAAIRTARSSDEVIRQLAQLVEDAASQSETSATQAQSALILCEEIELATRQQQSAGEQVLQTLTEVGLVAQENASGSRQISVTARQLEEMSGSLREALTV